MKIAIAGASGFIGSLLAEHLKQQGHDVWRLVRNREEIGDKAFFWAPELEQMDELAVEQLSSSDAVIQLCGADLLTKRWSSEQKKVLKDSRVQTTAFLAKMASQCRPPPKIWIQASGIGYYGNRMDEELDEESAPGLGFLANLAKEWEGASLSLEKKGVRRVLLRLGMVLSGKGGPLPRAIAPFKWGLGGTIGSGQQYMSWIAADDLLRVVDRALADEALSGVVNAVSPHPITQKEWTKTLGKVLKRPTWLPVPAFLVRLLLGEVADELLLSSAKVQPKKLLDLGFSFQLPALKEALDWYLKGKN